MQLAALLNTASDSSESRAPSPFASGSSLHPDNAAVGGGVASTRSSTRRASTGALSDASSRRSRSPAVISDSGASSSNVNELAATAAPARRAAKGKRKSTTATARRASARLEDAKPAQSEGDDDDAAGVDEDAQGEEDASTVALHGTSSEVLLAPTSPAAAAPAEEDVLMRDGELVIPSSDAAGLDLAQGISPVEPPVTQHEADDDVDPVSTARASLPEIGSAFFAYNPRANRAYYESQEQEDAAVAKVARAKSIAAKRSRMAAAARALKGKGKAGEEDEEVDDRRYCICQEIYDPERLMIQCDLCEDWYHASCVGIPDDSVHLIDLFVCPHCETKTGRTSTRKDACARPQCRHASRGLSKYCSDFCGVMVAATRIELTARVPESFAPDLRGARRPRTTTTFFGENPFLSKKERGRHVAEVLRAKYATHLVKLEQRREVLEDRVMLATQRLRYFRSVAFPRCLLVCQSEAAAEEAAEAEAEAAAAAAAAAEAAAAEAAAEEAEEEQEGDEGARKKKKKSRAGGGKKKGKPVSATSAPTALCCFDRMLAWDDEQWREWLADDTNAERIAMLDALGTDLPPEDRERTEPLTLDEIIDLFGEPTEELVCLKRKGKDKQVCARHHRWGPVREGDFSHEKAKAEEDLERAMEQHEAYSQLLIEQDNILEFERRQAEASRAQPIDVSGRMPPIKLAPKPRRSALTLGPSVPASTQLPSAAPSSEHATPEPLLDMQSEDVKPQKAAQARGGAVKGKGKARASGAAGTAQRGGAATKSKNWRRDAAKAAATAAAAAAASAVKKEDVEMSDEPTALDGDPLGISAEDIQFMPRSKQQEWQRARKLMEQQRQKR